MATNPITIKGFIKDWQGNRILPITRGELVLDKDGNSAFNSRYFEAGYIHPDGTINTYGLISAAERALLTGGGEGHGIQDIYNKLEYLNEGLFFNNTSLKLYNAEGAATPIQISASDKKGINLVVNGNNVDLGLVEINDTKTSVSQIIRNITVDEFGRVTAVSGSALTNEDLPDQIVGKTIKTGILDDCTTVNKEIGTNELAVANKAYVDAKFNEANGVATGALKFIGVLSDATTASNALSNQNSWNGYYKVTGSFDIAESDLEDTAGLKVVNSKVTVKVGDTLIVYPPVSGSKGTFICIPSADDVTRITVKGDSEESAAFTSRDGEVTFRFSEIFNVTNPAAGSSTALISIPYATAERDGYLTKEDFAQFKNYSNNLAVSYEGEIKTQTEGVYKIGTITVGSGEKDILGRYNVSGLSLNNGSTSGENQELNPILKFTETGADDVDITFKGVYGIGIRKNNNSVEFRAINEVDANSSKYLEVQDGYKFKAVIGKVENQQIVHGLTDYAEFATFRSNVITTSTVHEVIDYSLKDTTKDFYYGSDKLKTAIALAEDII